MAHAYTPGLMVTPRHRHRVRRVLPIPGDVLVEAGNRVAARDVVAHANQPGDITPINLANQLSMPPGDVPAAVIVSEGDAISVGQTIAKTPGIFGMFQADYLSKVAGRVESISHVSGQLIVRGDPVPVEVLAYLSGEVVELIPEQGVVIEAEATYIQGIFGIGGEAYGPLRMACDTPDQPLSVDLLQEEMRGCVVVGGARVTGETVRRAIEMGVSALVSGGIDDQDLRDILGYDLGVAVTGSEKIGLTLIITEGFGDIGMARRTFELLQSCTGRETAVNGSTQIRAGVQRPEIVIPLGTAAATDDQGNGRMSGALEVGTPVRIIRDPYFGVLGRVASLPSEPHILDSGAKARVLNVECESGETLTIPRANVEIIGG